MINLYKPPGISSAMALYRVRRLCGQRKSGHAGTLDPAAEGVLLLCLGRVTKRVEQLMELPKEYRAEARLDVTSESFDSGRPLIPVPSARPPSRAEIETAMQRFTGVIEQRPPAVSAIKIAGRPAYKLERRGQLRESSESGPMTGSDGSSFALKPRPVRIDWVRILEYGWPRIVLAMRCGRGTYVRALIRDLGEVLGTGGCLTGLVRMAVGPFRAADAWTLERLETATPAEYVLPLARLDELLTEARNPA